jgi:hypothetical protein
VYGNRLLASSLTASLLLPEVAEALEGGLFEPEPAARTVADCDNGVSAGPRSEKRLWLGVQPVYDWSTTYQSRQWQCRCASYMRTQGRKLTKGFRNHHIGCFRIYIGCGHGVRGSGAARALQQGLRIQPQQRVGAGVRVGREPPRLVLRHNKPPQLLS